MLEFIKAEQMQFKLQTMQAAIFNYKLNFKYLEHIITYKTTLREERVYIFVLLIKRIKLIKKSGHWSNRHPLKNLQRNKVHKINWTRDKIMFKGKKREIKREW